MDDKARVAQYRQDARKARELVQQIDDRVWRFSEAHGNEPMRDVTEERRAEHVRMAEMFENLADAWVRRFVNGMH